MPAPVSPDAERLMELLPCPFCGGEATLEKACLVRDTYHWVTCRNELCVVKCHGFQSLTERDAIAAWNKRATQPDAGAMAEAESAQQVVDRFVREMLDMGNPVEMTHKSGFRPDHIPTDWIKCPDREEEIARCLIEGWSSKSALVDLVYLLLTDAARREAAGFARGVEEAAKVVDAPGALDLGLSLSQNERAMVRQVRNVLARDIRNIASAGRALLGEEKE